MAEQTQTERLRARLSEQDLVCTIYRGDRDMTKNEMMVAIILFALTIGCMGGMLIGFINGTWGG